MAGGGTGEGEELARLRLMRGGFLRGEEDSFEGIVGFFGGFG
jgi:hypothetical protein